MADLLTILEAGTPAKQVISPDVFAPKNGDNVRPITIESSLLKTSDGDTTTDEAEGETDKVLPPAPPSPPNPTEAQYDKSPNDDPMGIMMDKRWTGLDWKSQLGALANGVPIVGEIGSQAMNLFNKVKSDVQSMTLNNLFGKAADALSMFKVRTVMNHAFSLFNGLIGLDGIDYTGAINKAKAALKESVEEIDDPFGGYKTFLFGESNLRTGKARVINNYREYSSDAYKKLAGKNNDKYSDPFDGKREYQFGSIDKWGEAYPVTTGLSYSKDFDEKGIQKSTQTKRNDFAKVIRGATNNDYPDWVSMNKFFKMEAATEFFWAIRMNPASNDKLPKSPFNDYTDGSGWLPASEMSIDTLEADEEATIPTPFFTITLPGQVKLPNKIKVSVIDLSGYKTTTWLRENYKIQHPVIDGMPSVYVEDITNLVYKLEVFIYNADSSTYMQRTFFGIPNCDISYNGSSSKTAKIYDIEFNIIGQIFPND